MNHDGNHQTDFDNARYDPWPKGLAILTPMQMVMFSLVVMSYVPCVATIAALVKEFGWKKAAFITVFEILFAIFAGGLAFRILLLLRIL